MVSKLLAISDPLLLSNEFATLKYIKLALAAVHPYRNTQKNKIFM